MKEIFEPLTLVKEWPAHLEAFRALAVSNPILAVVVGTLCIGIAWFVIARQSRIFVNEHRAQLRHKWLEYAATGVVCFVIAIMLVSGIREEQKPRPKLIASPTAVGRLELKWMNPATDDSRKMVYVLQAALDASFAKLDFDGEETPFQAISLPFSESIGGLRYWRVGAKGRAVDGENDRDEGKPAEVLWSKPARIAFYPTVTTKIQRTKTLKVAFSDTLDDGWFLFLGGAKGVTGFDYAVAQGVTRRLSKYFGLASIRMEPMSVSWKELLDQPGRRNADVIISMITVTTERMRKYDLTFSEPYFKSSQVLVASESRCTENYRTADIALREAVRQKRRIGVHADTTNADLLRLIKSALPGLIVEEVKDSSLVDLRLRSTSELRWDYAIVDDPLKDALASRNAHCVSEHLAISWDDLVRLGVKPEAIATAKRNLGVTTSGDGSISENFAIGMLARDHDLVEVVNQAIKEMKESNEMMRLIAQAQDEWKKVRGR